MSTSQKVFFKNIFGNPVCCVLRTRKLRSKFVGSIICEANYPEGARTARIGEANQASECNGVLYFVLPPEQNQHGARDHACVGSFAERQRAERSECRDGADFAKQNQAASTIPVGTPA